MLSAQILDVFLGAQPLIVNATTLMFWRTILNAIRHATLNVKPTILNANAPQTLNV
jgi:hypothetical protein